MSSAVRTLILPVETIARELDGKVLLALVARERGWTVYLGDQTVFRASLTTLPKGVYLSKSARSRNAGVFTLMHGLGHQIAVLDEEALVRQTDDIYLMKHERDALTDVSLLMTWGEENTQLWANSGKCDPARIRTTGNPRVDMLRADMRAFHKPEMDDIRARYGDYVLVNSNFATVNHFITGATRFGLATWVPKEERERQRATLLGHKAKLFAAFLTLLPKVARAIAPMTLVIRPHPSEAHQPWEAAVAGCDNVVVAFEGSVVPWLAGARALIHNGCTTAVEAAVLGTTSLAYRPVISESFDNPLPNGLSIECFDDDALIGALNGVLADGPRPLNEAQKATLDYFITGKTGKLACENIVEALEQAGLGSGSGRPVQPLPWLQAVAGRYGSVLRRGIGKLYARGRNRQAYRARKFPELTPDLVNGRIDRFRAVLGRFGDCSARHAARNLFIFD